MKHQTLNFINQTGPENGDADPEDVDVEEAKEGKEIEGEEEDEIEEDPDKRNRLDGYYVAMGIILGLCILGTLSYMAGKVLKCRSRKFLQIEIVECSLQ